MVSPDEPSACTRSANGQGLFCSPKRSREHVPETFGNVFGLTWMFRDVSDNGSNLRRDTFRRNDAPRVKSSTLLHLLRGHGTSPLLPPSVRPEQWAGGSMGLAGFAVLAGAHEPIGPALYRFEDVVGQAVDELLCPFLGLFAGAFHKTIGSAHANPG